MKYILSALWLLILSTGASAAVDKHYIRRIDGAGQLADMTVNAIFRDSVGYVWFGTGTSLERFDGVRLRHYPLPGSDGVRQSVRAIVEVPGTGIFAGNGSGLWLHSGGCSSDSLFVAVLPDEIKAVNALVRMDGDTIAVGTDTGLIIYDAASGRRIRKRFDNNASDPFNHINDFSIAGDTMYIATAGGMVALSRRSGAYKRYPAEFNGRPLSLSIAHAVGDRVYLGTMEYGLFVFDISTGKVSPYINIGSNVISALSSDRDGALYVGTDGAGVTVINTETGKIMETMRHEAGKENVLHSNSVYSLLIDNDDLLWIGYYQLGADYTLSHSDMFTLFSTDGFNSQGVPIRTVTIAGDNMYVGTRDGLYIVNRRDGRAESVKVPQLRSNMIVSTCFYDGRLLIGLYGGGMYVYDPSTRKVSDFDSGKVIPFVNGHIFSIRPDNSGDLWIGTSDGLYQYSGGRLKAHYTSADSALPPGNVYEVYFDSRGRGWICTENGMCIYDPKSGMLSGSFPDGFFNADKIRVVLEDSAHNLYFVPDKGSVYRSSLDLKVFDRLSPSMFDGNDVKAIVEDLSANMWITTSNGIFRWDKVDKVDRFNFSDGVPNPIFINCTPAVDGYGNIWFGNSKGLMRLAGEDVDRAPAACSILLSEVCANGQPSYSTEISHPSDSVTRVRFDRNYGTIALALSALNFTDPESIRYEYRMEGDDTVWLPVPSGLKIVFYDFPSGTSHLRVRRVGDDGGGFLYEIYMPYPDWIWIVTALGVVLAVLIICAVRLVMRRRNRAGEAIMSAHDQETRDAVASVSPENGSGRSSSKPKYSVNKISDAECRAIAERLDRIIAQDKIYTNPDLTLTDLASIVGTTNYKMSYFFSQYLRQNYYDYINRLRIAEFKRIVAGDKSRRYTLSALSEMSGFSSRSSFFRYFKKIEGMSPAEYIKSRE